MSIFGALSEILTQSTTAKISTTKSDYKVPNGLDSKTNFITNSSSQHSTNFNSNSNKIVAIYPSHPVDDTKILSNIPNTNNVQKDIHSSQLNQPAFKNIGQDKNKTFAKNSSETEETTIVYPTKNQNPEISSSEPNLKSHNSDINQIHSNFMNLKSESGFQTDEESAQSATSRAPIITDAQSTKSPSRTKFSSARGYLPIKNNTDFVQKNTPNSAIKVVGVESRNNFDTSENPTTEASPSVRSGKSLQESTPKTSITTLTSSQQELLDRVAILSQLLSNFRRDKYETITEERVVTEITATPFSRTPKNNLVVVPLNEKPNVENVEATSSKVDVEQRFREGKAVTQKSETSYEDQIFEKVYSTEVPETTTSQIKEGDNNNEETTTISTSTSTSKVEEENTPKLGLGINASKSSNMDSVTNLVATSKDEVAASEPTSNNPIIEDKLNYESKEVDTKETATIVASVNITPSTTTDELANTAENGTVTESSSSSTPETTSMAPIEESPRSKTESRFNVLQRLLLERNQLQNKTGKSLSSNQQNNVQLDQKQTATESTLIFKTTLSQSDFSDSKFIIVTPSNLPESTTYFPQHTRLNLTTRISPVFRSNNVQTDNDIPSSLEDTTTTITPSSSSKVPNILEFETAHETTTDAKNYVAPTTTEKATEDPISINSRIGEEVRKSIQAILEKYRLNDINSIITTTEKLVDSQNESIEKSSSITTSSNNNLEDLHTQGPIKVDLGFSTTTSTNKNDAKIDISTTDISTSSESTATTTTQKILDTTTTILPTTSENQHITTEPSPSTTKELETSSIETTTLKLDKDAPLTPANTDKLTLENKDLQSSSSTTELSVPALTSTILPSVLSRGKEENIQEIITTSSTTYKPRFQDSNRATFAPFGTQSSTSPPKRDYVIYGILPNSTVVQKEPEENRIPINDQVDVDSQEGLIVYAILPNSTIVKKFPNGTVVRHIDSSVRVLDVKPWDLSDLIRMNEYNKLRSGFGAAEKNVDNALDTRIDGTVTTNESTHINLDPKIASNLTNALTANNEEFSSNENSTSITEVIEVVELITEITTVTANEIRNNTASTVEITSRINTNNTLDDSTINRKDSFNKNANKIKESDTKLLNNVGNSKGDVRNPKALEDPSTTNNGTLDETGSTNPNPISNNVNMPISITDSLVEKATNKLLLGGQLIDIIVRSSSFEDLSKSLDETNEKLSYQADLTTVLDLVQII